MPKPTKAMMDQARQGLELRKEWGRGGTEVGVARARDISNGADLSMETVGRMVSYFARHGSNFAEHYGEKEADGGPNAFTISWKLWGGSPGRTWSKKVFESKDEKMSTQAEPEKTLVEENEERHIQQITETEDQVIIVFGKSEEFTEESEDELDEAGYKKKKKKYEREARQVSNLEVRSLDDSTVTVEGYAAVFNQETNIGGQWREQIAPGAFTDAIDRDDVVFLINHDGLPLARTRSGTLELSEDDHGLKMKASLDITDPDVRSIVPKMKRGDLDKMSFAFMPTRQSWNEGEELPLRTIQEASLFDVSIVTTPAYAGTDIGLRSLQEYRAQKTTSQSVRRLRMKSKLLK